LTDPFHAETVAFRDVVVNDTLLTAAEVRTKAFVRNDRVEQ